MVGKSSERVISLCLQEGVSLFGGGDLIEIVIHASTDEAEQSRDTCKAL